MPTTAGEAASPFSALPHSLTLHATRSLPPAHLAPPRSRPSSAPSRSSPKLPPPGELIASARRAARFELPPPASLFSSRFASLADHDSSLRHFSFPRLLSLCSCLSLSPLRLFVSSSAVHDVPPPSPFRTRRETRRLKADARADADDPYQPPRDA